MMNNRMPENIILAAIRCQAPSYSTTFPGKSINYGTGSVTQGSNMLSCQELTKMSSAWQL